MNSTKENYLKVSDAARLVGYSNDHVTRLARTGKIIALRDGRQWFVDVDSLKIFTLKVEAQKRERNEKIRQQRIQERVQNARAAEAATLQEKINTSKVSALTQTFVFVLSVFLLGNVIWFAIEANLNVRNLAMGFNFVSTQFSEVVPIPAFVSQVASFAFVDPQAPYRGVTDEVVTESFSQSNTSSFDGVIIIEAATPTTDHARVIEQWFSDEVNVRFDSDNSGYIQPIFKNHTGEEYQFLLQPADFKSIDE